MKEKNKSTIFYITIIIVLFTALLYMSQRKQSSAPVIKIVKEEKTVSTIIERVLAMAMPSINIAVLLYVISGLYAMSSILKPFARKITKRPKRPKTKRNEKT